MTPSCKGMGTKVFFDDDPTKALSICGECPVVQKCRDKTLAIEKGTPREYRFGVFGGLTPDERADLDGVA